MSETVPLTEIRRATAWLEAVLSAGPLPVVEVEKLAGAVGISRRTLRRARGRLGVESSPDGFQGRRMLSLPEGAASVDHGARSDNHVKVRTDPPPVHAVAQTANLHPDQDRRQQPRDTAIRRVRLRRVQ